MKIFLQQKFQIYGIKHVLKQLHYEKISIRTYLCLWSTYFSSSNSINSRHTCRERRGEDTQWLDGVVTMGTGASRTSNASRDGHGVHHTHCYGIARHILADSRQKLRRILDKGMRRHMGWGNIWTLLYVLSRVNMPSLFQNRRLLLLLSTPLWGLTLSVLWPNMIVLSRPPG